MVNVEGSNVEVSVADATGVQLPPSTFDCQTYVTLWVELASWLLTIGPGSAP